MSEFETSQNLNASPLPKGEASLPVEQGREGVLEGAEPMSPEAAVAEGLEFGTGFYQKRKKGKFREVEAPRFEVPIADTHCHLGMLENPPARLARCAYYGVEFVCCMTDPYEVAIMEDSYGNLENWRAQAAQLLQDAGRGEYASRVPHLRLAIGCHPHNAKYYDDAMEAVLVQYLRDARTCALGEVGLDYHYDFSPRETQREVFRRQIRVAHQAGLPLILHMREAHDEGFAILQEEGFPKAGVLLHCFNLDAKVLAPWAEAGCHVAYGGPFTFKKADGVREGALHVAPNKLLTETDSPYMTPEPLRGVTCGPEFTIFTAEKLCEVLGKETADERRELLQQVYNNALDLLNREPTSWQKAGAAPAAPTERTSNAAMNEHAASAAGEVRA